MTWATQLFAKELPRMNKLIVAGGLALLVAQIATANTPWDWESRFGYRPAGQKFSEQEFSVDLFGVGASREREYFDDDNTGGLGVGANYFFLRYLGVSVDSYVDDFDVPRHVDFSAVARFPLEECSLALTFLPAAVGSFMTALSGRATSEVESNTV
jgi:hypothetical protein